MQAKHLDEKSATEPSLPIYPKVLLVEVEVLLLANIFKNNIKIVLKHVEKRFIRLFSLNIPKKSMSVKINRFYQSQVN